MWLISVITKCSLILARSPLYVRAQIVFQSCCDPHGDIATSWRFGVGSLISNGFSNGAALTPGRGKFGNAVCTYEKVS